MRPIIIPSTPKYPLALQSPRHRHTPTSITNAVCSGEPESGESGTQDVSGIVTNGASVSGGRNDTPMLAGQRGHRRTWITKDSRTVSRSLKLNSDYSVLFSAQQKKDNRSVKNRRNSTGGKHRVKTIPASASNDEPELTCSDLFEMFVPDQVPASMPDAFGRAVKSSPLMLSSAGQAMSQGQNVGRLGKKSEPRVETVPASNDEQQGENVARLRKKRISWNEAVVVLGDGLNPLKEAAKSMPSRVMGVTRRRIQKRSPNTRRHRSDRTRSSPADVYSNVFFLLSSRGNSFQDLWRAEVPRFEWSSEEKWYFAGVDARGFAWGVTTRDVYIRILDHCRTLQILPHDFVTRKKSFVLAANSMQDVLKNDWEQYVSHRFETLHSLGWYALSTYLDIYPDVSRSTEGKPHQSMVWNNNSCALDSVICVVPHLCVRISRTALFRKPILGRNGCFHSPAAILLVAMQALRECGDPMIHSNWARHLTNDIVNIGKANEHTQTRNREWSCFDTANQFRCLRDTIWILQYLLGKGCSRFEDGDIPDVMEIATYIPLQVFRTIEWQLVGDKTTLASFLYHCILKSQGEPKVGIFFLALMPNTTRYRGWLKSKFQTSWKGSYQPLASDTNWNIELLAVVGSRVNNSSHFASATCHYHPTQHLEFFDGMESNGKAEVTSATKVLMGGGAKLDLNGLFLVFMVTIAS